MQRLLTGTVRLAGFEGEWEEVKMGKLFERKKATTTDSDVPVYTISSTQGFMTQKDKFNRVIAGTSLKKYIYLSEGDFSYNKGNSKTYPYGCIFNFTDKKGVVPFVYISFRSKVQLDTDFYRFFFKAGLLNRQLKRIISSGARSDGLLNVNPTAFFKCTVPQPMFEEQQKIGAILNASEHELQLLYQKLAGLREQQRGLMARLLTGAVRV